MSWRICKIETNENVKTLIAKGVAKDRKQAAKFLAKESGIPVRTIEDWVYEISKEEKEKLAAEMGSTENRAGEISNETEEIENPKPKPNPIIDPIHKRDICIVCNKNPLYKHPQTGKPYGKTSLTYGLCKACDRRHQNIRAKDRKATEETGTITWCPHCKKSHYVDNQRIINGVKRNGRKSKQKTTVN